jgi:hypothetical protein
MTAARRPDFFALSEELRGDACALKFHGSVRMTRRGSPHWQQAREATVNTIAGATDGLGSLKRNPVIAINPDLSAAGRFSRNIARVTPNRPCRGAAARAFRLRPYHAAHVHDERNQP